MAPSASRSANPSPTASDAGLAARPADLCAGRSACARRRAFSKANWSRERRKASGFGGGERVFHQKFGYGRVTRVDGNKLTIDFDKAGEKRVSTVCRAGCERSSSEAMRKKPWLYPLSSQLFGSRVRTKRARSQQMEGPMRASLFWLLPWCFLASIVPAYRRRLPLQRLRLQGRRRLAGPDGACVQKAALNQICGNPCGRALQA